MIVPCFATLSNLAPPPPASIVATVWDLILKGGILMVPIAICSMIGLAIAIERAVSLRRSWVVPPGFVDAARAALREGPDRALALCRAQPSPMARIFAAALQRWHRSPADVEKQIIDAGLREAALLRSNLRGLALIAAVSPLLGLLGTIFGMITAFRTVAESAEALGRTELLAGGIYVAMVTTAAGLIVAIPAVVLHHWLSAKVDRLMLVMDEACIELADQHAAHTSGIDRAPQLAA